MQVSSVYCLPHVTLAKPYSPMYTLNSPSSVNMCWTLVRDFRSFAVEHFHTKRSKHDEAPWRLCAYSVVMALYANAMAFGAHSACMAPSPDMLLSDPTIMFTIMQNWHNRAGSTEKEKPRVCAGDVCDNEPFASSVRPTVLL